MHVTDRKMVERRMEMTLGNLLRTGVIAAASVILFGGIFYLLRHALELPEYAVFHGQPTDFRTFSGITRGIFTFKARAIIQLGFLLLIATPVARVAFSVYGFAKEKDRVFVAVTLFVLIMLIFGLTGGRL